MKDRHVEKRWYELRIFCEFCLYQLIAKSPSIFAIFGSEIANLVEICPKSEHTDDRQFQSN